MEKVSEVVTVFFAAVIIAAMGFEIRRRQILLREVYDVLDSETKHIAAELELMVQQGKLKPYTEDTWV